MQQRVCRQLHLSTEIDSKANVACRDRILPLRYRVSRAQDLYLVHGPVHQMFWSLHQEPIQAGRCPIPAWLHWECAYQGNNIFHTSNARPATVNRQQECGPGQQGLVQF